MKFGVTIPNNWGQEDPQQVLAFGPLAEELDYDSVWVMDHLFNNGYIRERLDDKPYYHPLATLSHLSAMTKRVILGTSVLVLPYHNPVELAKYAATLDQMSGGRVTLGVGAGAMTEEFEALGIPMRQRASLTIGGSSPGALKRAATVGDGWHPSGVSPEEYSIGRRAIQDLAKAAGRDPDSLTWSARVEVEMHGGPSSNRAASRSRLPGDSPDQLTAGIRAYESAGVEHVVLALNSGDVSRIAEVMEIIAREVIPQFR
jgi:alkanesulfonate monooxygenase SsuD/methylene tetrahydromethanopterin reductase-like flavin-dependent oxidoreductase (luciferase family)